MLPRWHILFGAIFSFMLWFFIKEISFTALALVFLSSFLIDFDHYLVSILKTKKLSIKESFNYHKTKFEEENRDIAEGVKRKSDFHLFHTVEFHALIGVISLSFSPLLYVFIGMVFHSMLDLISLIYGGRLHRREFFLSSWLFKKSWSI